MIIRAATAADAEAISRLLCASIRELCGRDHSNNPTAIRNWCANKSPDAIGQWFDAPRRRLLVAEEDGRILCVGAISEDGEILLNYVAPAERFRGLSKAMLRRLEEELARTGIIEARLTSTETAHSFYRNAGWEDRGEPQRIFGLPCYPMTKRLARTGAGP